jgi:hypothetical protein
MYFQEWPSEPVPSRQGISLQRVGGLGLGGKKGARLNWKQCDGRQCRSLAIAPLGWCVSCSMDERGLLRMAID